jgi:Domain of unknown function (DUF3437)
VTGAREQDNWAEHKAQFTPEELEVVNELFVSPHYYAWALARAARA